MTSLPSYAVSWKGTVAQRYDEKLNRLITETVKSQGLEIVGSEGGVDFTTMVSGSTLIIECNETEATELALVLSQATGLDVSSRLLLED